MTDKDRTREALGPSVHSFCTGPRKWLSYEAEQEFKRGSVKSDNSTILFVYSHLMCSYLHTTAIALLGIFEDDLLLPRSDVNSLNPCSWAAAK